MADDPVEKVLSHIEPERRAFLKKIIVGTAFAVPAVASFSMDGLSAYEANAAQGSNVPSDRHAKEQFAPVDAQAILSRVLQLPIETWNYRGQAASIRHIGPMAQDFAALFGVGEDDRHINLLDSAGIALAAIQALAQRVEAQEAEMQALRAELRGLNPSRPTTTANAPS